MVMIPQGDKSEEAIEGADADLTESILAFIEAHFGEEMYAEAIAEHFGINREYACRIVKRSTGPTVVEFLHRIRIEEAKRLLRESDACIYQIADRVGFRSPCYFSKVFKKLEGRSPKEYQRLHLLGDGGGEA